jgi:hypothetical protein
MLSGGLQLRCSLGIATRDAEPCLSGPLPVNTPIALAVTLPRVQNRAWPKTSSR